MGAMNFAYIHLSIFMLAWVVWRRTEALNMF